MIQRLITDHDIRQGVVSSPIVLAPGTVITPAARDRAIAMGMTIVEGDAAARTPAASPAPVGVQLMGADLDALGGSARNAVEAGVPLVDLNFGCPAKGALRGCAGAAQLRDPAGLEHRRDPTVRTQLDRRGHRHRQW